MQLLTVYEFAERVKVCPHTIRRAIKKGKINAFRPGVGKKSPYRIPETEVDRLLVMTGMKRTEE